MYFFDCKVRHFYARNQIFMLKNIISHHYLIILNSFVKIDFHYGGPARSQYTKAPGRPPYGSCPGANPRCHTGLFLDKFPYELRPCVSLRFDDIDA